MKKILLHVNNLSKTYFVKEGFFRKKKPIHAVDQISFNLYSNEVVGLVGESGSGKSTAAKCAIRLIEPTKGTIKLCDIDLLTLSQKKLRQMRHTAQMIFQNPFSSLNPKKTIFQILSQPLYYLHALTPSECKKRISKVLEQVGISEKSLLSFPHEFSGGQQQRICIARALSIDPKVLICDEPTSALDLSIQAQILNLLAKIQKEKKISLLLISHDLFVIQHFCDRVYVMKSGKIVESGMTKEIFSRPQHPYTQKLIASLNTQRESF